MPMHETDVKLAAFLEKHGFRDREPGPLFSGRPLDARDFPEPPAPVDQVELEGVTPNLEARRNAREEAPKAPCVVLGASDGGEGPVLPREGPPPPRLPAWWQAMTMADEAMAVDLAGRSLEAADETAARAFVHRLPPYAAALRDNDPKAFKDWQATDRQRAAIARELAGCFASGVDWELDEAGEPVLTPAGTPRIRVDEVTMRDKDDEYYLHLPRCRSLPQNWTADPQYHAEMLALCSSGHELLGASKVHKMGKGRFSSRATGCNQVHYCPVCARRRSAVEANTWAPILGELRQRGQQLVHITLTVRSTEHQLGMFPVAITDAEYARGYRPPKGYRRAKPGERAVPAGGASLGESLEVLRNAKRIMTSSTANRETWARLVSAQLGGFEWTGARKLKLDNGTVLLFLRYHAHMHLLAVVDADIQIPVRARQVLGKDGEEGFVGHYAVHSSEVDEADEDIDPADCGWWDAIVAMWRDAVEQAGGSAEVAGQEARVVAYGEHDDDDVMRAVKEVVKYPFKHADMTRAQLAEVVTTIKGSKTRIRQGSFHASNSVYKDASDRHRLRHALASMLAVLTGQVHDLHVLQVQDMDKGLPRSLDDREHWYVERVEARVASMFAAEAATDDDPPRSKVYRRLHELDGVEAPAKVVTELQRPLPDLPPVEVDVVVREPHAIEDTRPPGPPGWCVVTESDLLALSHTGIRTLEIAWYDAHRKRMVNHETASVRELMEDMRTPPREERSVRATRKRGGQDGNEDRQSGAGPPGPDD